MTDTPNEPEPVKAWRLALGKWVLAGIYFDWNAAAWDCDELNSRNWASDRYRVIPVTITKGQTVNILPGL